MNFRKLFASSVFLKSIFVVSISILLFIASVSYKHSVSLTKSSDWLVHSYKAHLELEQLISHLKNAESGQRGFIITQDTIFLEPFYNARKEINQSVQTLKKLTADNPKQQTNLDLLYSLIDLRFTLLLNSLKQSAQKPVDKEVLNNNLLTGKHVMDSIDKNINKMVELEMQYLKERQKKYDDEISFTPLGTLFLLLFPLIIFVISYFKINKDVDVLKKSNKELLIKTESIKHAEEIGEFSSWQWDLQTNKLIYSDNQYRLMGCEPQSFEPTLQNFFEFVHPDDKNILLQNRIKIMNQNDPTKVNFRIIRKDGTVRYWESISKLIIDLNGSKIRIGINRDISEQHLSKIVLEEKNFELEQINKELATFNHMASHDLQEPLRKIQTFISRILEKEIRTVSATGKEYFERIQVAAKRMRILIDDLLLFSKTNKAEKVFEGADLNVLLENAKQELLQVIQEKTAVIESVQLPVLNVIPFQIQQLFINLIGNSLKYSREGIAPLITIHCKRMLANEDPVLKTVKAEVYFKISFTDNGLGFDQQYAENIFTLFYRLHQDSDYPGTGIGLSICKKIIENHNGFITAEGKPGMGSTFNIYLPD